MTEETKKKMSQGIEKKMSQGIEKKMSQGIIKKSSQGIVKKKEKNTGDTGYDCCKLTKMDSIDPSYTDLVLPYRVTCRQRYIQERKKQEAQFIKEIQIHELLQIKALDGVKIHRIFSKATLKPKSSKLVKVTREQEMKIEEILKTNY